MITSFDTSKSFKPLIKQYFSIVLLPVITTLIIGFCYLLAKHYLFAIFKTPSAMIDGINNGFLALIFLNIYWFCARFIEASKNYFLSYALFYGYQIIGIILPFISTVLKTVVFLAFFNALIPYLGFSVNLAYILNRINSILIICAFTWILFRLTASTEKLILHRYQVKPAGDFVSRRRFTQMLILKRITLMLITILALGAILMLFDNVRALGASVLTTAGVIGLVLTFTAQRSLTSLFSGLEIALTQPIKLGDAIVIENEFGIIEEINFRHVVVKLWDWRRLIVPTNFFLEKPFQNWSREQSNNLIGTSYLYCDFTLPLAPLRHELKRILQKSPLWDGEVCNIQVSDLKEQVMELRILTSARSPAEAWDLRCEVREQLMAFIAHRYPLCLPTRRNKQMQERLVESEELT